MLRIVNRLGAPVLLARSGGGMQRLEAGAQLDLPSPAEYVVLGWATDAERAEFGRPGDPRPIVLGFLLHGGA